MAYTLAEHKRRYVNSPTGYYSLSVDDIANSSNKAAAALSLLPQKVRSVAEHGWLKIANGVPAYLDTMHDIDRADKWIENLARPFKNNPLPLDLNASDNDIIELAERTAKKFEQGIVFKGWDLPKQIEQAAKLGVDWDSQFAEQIKNGWLDAISARLCDKRWWKRHLRREMCRRLEHIYRGHCNLVHKRKWLYASDDAVMRRRQQKARNAAVMQAAIMVNELGQEFSLAELVEKSNANPVIRRAELMVRIAGFETIARDLGHCGEFITMTCPSRFHRAHHISGGENKKYDDSTPRDASVYLGKVWARIQAALAREEIQIYGFRVVEPHHDGCPHWHGLFFMEKQHRKVFRKIVARYTCRADREELGLKYFETDTARKAWAREIQAAQKARGEKPQSLAKISGSLKLEAEFWDNADWRVFQDVQARVDFEAINWKKGTAAGYIAKYIAKNIDGKNVYGESVGDDYEADGAMSAIEAAERVDAWASLWGIRQFQQIGGAPVTVWRELRREFHDNTHDDSDIIRAARAADLGDWGKFTQIMGGVALKRADRPVQLYKELPTQASGEVWTNRYGEPLDKAIRGVFELSTGEIRFTRVHEWTVVLKNGAQAPAWTCVNNSTKLPTLDFSVKKCKEIKLDFDYFLSKVLGGLTDEHKQHMKMQLAIARGALMNDDVYVSPEQGYFAECYRDDAIAELAKIRIFKETGLLPNGKTPAEQAQEYFEKSEYCRALSRQSAQEYAEKQKVVEREREQREYLAVLDRLSPPTAQLTAQYRQAQREQAELREQFRQPAPRERKFAVPAQHDTLDVLLNKADDVLSEFQAAMDELWLDHDFEF